MRILEALVYWIRSRAAGILANMMDRLPPRPTPQDYLFGIRMINFASEAEFASHRAKIEQALTLILHYDPRRFRRVQRDLRIIIIDDLPKSHSKYSAIYSVGTSTCILSPTLLSKPVSTVACVIVHEATHARLDHGGVWQTNRRRKRIEAVCRNQEVEFVKSWPSTPELQAWITKREAAEMQSALSK